MHPGVFVVGERSLVTPRQAASGCLPPPTTRTGDLRPPSNASVEPRSWCIRSLGVNLNSPAINCEGGQYPLAASVSLGSLSHGHIENGNLTTSHEYQPVSSGQFPPLSPDLTHQVLGIRAG